MPTSRSRLGTRGEEAARAYLKSRGYQILSTNFRCRWGEIDIIAQDGDCLAFIEVRTRSNYGYAYGAPQESISQRKRVRLVATAETYLQNSANTPADWRIDLIAVRVDKKGAIGPVEHIKNAIEGD